MKNTVSKKRQKKTRMAVNSTASRNEYKRLKKNYEQTEKQSANNKMMKMIFVILLIIIALIFVFMSGAFDISEINVEGNTTISDEQIISFSGIEKGTNLFAISKKEVISKIKENPYVDKVRVKRCIPDKINLIIEERQVKYALLLANSFVYINGQGYILEISNSQPNVPIILGFTTDLTNIKENCQLEENDLNKLNVVTKIMETATNHKMQDMITQIDISDEEDFMIYFDKEGKVAYLGNGTELNTRFLYIKAILKEQQGRTGKIFVNMDLSAEYVYFSEEPI